MPKYSIILPTLNSVQYLPNCVETIVSQDYDDYELIISNNCSDDETAAYLKTLAGNTHIKVIRPKERLVLGEHWNFAISHAKGEWIYGIGSDDGVMPFFFNLLDKLTHIADSKNLNIIKTNRVYYFWEGLKEIYGDSYINFSAKANVRILSCKKMLCEVLYENPNKFFDIPQMYTTSVFRKDVLQKAKCNRMNKIIQDDMAHDTYLGLLGCIYENEYLYSDIPIGWVGSSPTSIGSNIKEFKQEGMFQNIKDFIANNPEAYYERYHFVESALKVDSLLLVRAILYFMKGGYDIVIPSALDMTEHTNLVKVYACVYKIISNLDDQKLKDERMFFLDDMLAYKGINKDEIIVISKNIANKKTTFSELLRKVVYKVNRALNKILHITNFSQKEFSIIQNYGNINAFKNMCEVNKFLAVNESILEMLDLIGCDL